MCECLSFDDGSMHTCEACASEYDALRAECGRLQKRCEALRKLRIRRCGSGRLRHCEECRCDWAWDNPERHAPGCLCAPEAGQSFDAPVFDPPLQPASNPLRPAPGEEKSR